MKSTVFGTLVLLASLLFVSATLSDIRLANAELNPRKIVLHSAVVDTQAEERLNLKYVNEADDEKLRQVYVHVKAPIAHDYDEVLAEAFESFSDAHYLPHNTFMMVFYFFNLI
jgi:hypothetical protein